MDNAFNCTQCGECCHNLNIPLSIGEAIDWLSAGHKLKILTEAIPWINDVAVTQEVLIRKKSMTFNGISGNLSIRVLMTLVGYFDGRCPNLDTNKNCTIYESRPLTCRIYPFEMNPMIPLNPANKLCPSEAWPESETLNKAKTIHPIIVMDTVTEKNIKKIYANSVADVASKKELCLHFGISTCSLSNNGYLFHFVDQQKLLSALEKLALNQTINISTDAPNTDWFIVTESENALSDLISVGGKALHARNLILTEQEFMHLSR